MVIQAIPYQNFKERCQIVKKNLGKAKIEVFDDFVYVEKHEDDPQILIRNGICPECGGNLLHESGCVTCPYCGWSACG